MQPPQSLTRNTVQPLLHHAPQPVYWERLCACMDALKCKRGRWGEKLVLETCRWYICSANSDWVCTLHAASLHQPTRMGITCREEYWFPYERWERIFGRWPHVPDWNFESSKDKLDSINICRHGPTPHDDTNIAVLFPCLSVIVFFGLA